ncbi:helix-turn-helix domain-containing protein [Paraburkholderia sp. 1N]|uniref:Helix-turn-helix domain-containing protein n=1 Tax=Paraburkholderia solitsugae TaxID=2675748 RepID=A0ABX2BHV5_9BURK|nr:helix-turn-helix domain-containing protein [Paraburkholderia solitsugae]NPT40532.1 helix-turn-helix domain-containing protein [Paraburkholderia solitsugae]
MAAPWEFAAEPRDAVVFHFVAEGRLRAATRHGKLGIAGCELILIPRGCGHEVAYSRRGRAMPLEAFLAKRDGIVDRNPRAVKLICDQFDMDQQLALPALRALPRAVSLRTGTERGCSPLSDTLRMLRNEVETLNFGSKIVVRNLLSSLFIHFMRDSVDTTSPVANDWSSGRRSPHMARAFPRIHEAPECAWTLEELSQEAGLSRAAFARNFSASVGEPPHCYLIRRCMGVAARLLEKTDLRLTEIASRVGYRSEFSFSRAFKSARGISPTQYRRAASNRAGALRI